MGQLSFDLEELQSFFTSVTNDEQKDVLKPLLKTTEGWIAGIQLIKLSTGGMIDNLSSEEILAKASSYIHEYFMQEILLILPQELQDFLLRTSILNYLEPSVCTSVTNELNSLTIFSELEKNCLFIEQVQAHPPVYRYHTLFRHALQVEFHRQQSYEMIASIYYEVATNLCQREDYVAAIELA